MSWWIIYYTSSAFKISKRNTHTVLLSNTRSKCPSKQSPLCNQDHLHAEQLTLYKTHTHAHTHNNIQSRVNEYIQMLPLQLLPTIILVCISIAETLKYTQQVILSRDVPLPPLQGHYQATYTLWGLPGTRTHTQTHTQKRRQREHLFDLKSQTPPCRWLACTKTHTHRTRKKQRKTKAGSFNFIFWEHIKSKQKGNMTVKHHTHTHTHHKPHSQTHLR